MAFTDRRERAVVLLVAAVQFVNILDFVMVMPTGPDFAAALGIAMLGLVAGTALGGVATGLHSLRAARVLAGLFGGPATSLAFSIVADVVPAPRRGTAMGVVMGAFSVPAVLGVAAGLELARQLGWRAPFFAVAGLGLVIALLAVFFLPPMRGHLAARPEKVPLAALLSQPNVLLSRAMTFVVMGSGFIVIPNISAYVQFNLGDPRARLGLLYLYGGIVSFFATQVAGRLVDRVGSFRVGTVGTTLLILTLAAGFTRVPALVPVSGLFMAFMLAMSFRNVSYNTLTTKVPRSAERARFMSIQSAVQHAAPAGALAVR